MKVLVCGGRDFNDEMAMSLALGEFHEKTLKITMIIHGGSKGADIYSGHWARHNHIHVAEVHALWDQLERSAGYKRNAAMLTLKPDYCIAFPGGKGTNMMIDLCNKAGVPVWEPYKC
jgi:hypothetical protein